MKDSIDELNQPVMRSHELRNKDTVYLPSKELIFQKHGKDKQALKNELLNMELTILKQYNELREYKEKDRLYQESSKTIQALKDEVVKYKKKALQKSIFSEQQNVSKINEPLVSFLRLVSHFY